MFEDVVTVFNRKEGLWYPTLLKGVEVQAVRAAEELVSGGILDGSVGTDCDVLLCAENGRYEMKISQKSCQTP